MSDTAVTVALATVISAVVAALSAYLTQRASTKAQVITTATASRSDLEREAFERAKDFYTDTIDRQATEIHEQAAELVGLAERVEKLEALAGRQRQSVDHYRRSAQRLARGLHELRLAVGDRIPETLNESLQEDIIEFMHAGEDDAD